MANLQSVLGGLGGVKLKHTTIEKDSSKPRFANVIEEQQIDDYHNKVLDLNIENWVHLIEKETFATRFHPMTIDDAKAFQEAYTQLVLNKEKKLSADVQAKIDKMEAGLQKVIDEVKALDSVHDCVFVKTSCRSPKDSAIQDARLRQLFRAELKKQPNPSDENDQVNAMLFAAIDILKSHSAQEVIKTFLISERIYQDMSVALSHPDRFNEHFVVRKWEDITPDLEFRGFYANGKLNALSQYNHLSCWPAVLAHKDALVTRIQKFFYDNVEPKLRSLKQYVVDFAVCGPQLDQVWVIELNPFVYTTDGCLFSWAQEQSILEHGPFTFRYVETRTPGGKTMLSPEWRVLIERESKQVIQELKDGK